MPPSPFPKGRAVTVALGSVAMLGLIGFSLQKTQREPTTGLSSEMAKTSDIHQTVSLQGGYQYGGYQQGGGYPGGNQQGGYAPQGGYGSSSGSPGGDTKLNLLISVLVPIVVLICVCCCVFQIIRCVCGEVCGGGMDPLLGAGLGAVAGYEMGEYMDGKNGPGGYPMY